MFRHYLISGRVQGVGYRRFVQRAAERLGVKGKVRNLLDGRVEAVVEGDEPILRELESLLAAGPSFSQVSKVDGRDLDARAFEAQSFDVVEDGESPWFVR